MVEALEYDISSIKFFILVFRDEKKNQEFSVFG